MKIIFLDFDGVLNHQEWYKRRIHLKDDEEYEYPNCEFDPNSIYELNRIIERTRADVVVSSTWRIGKRPIDLQRMLENVGFIGKIIDVTPRFFAKGFHGEDDENVLGYTTPRGCEIDWWLKEKGKFQRINWCVEKQKEYLEKSLVKNYVILDDDSDMLYNQREHYVKCNAYGNGLDWKTADRAIEILNTPITELYYET